ncbi:hypothetical protein IEQ34_012396 [Dendrobium chrysotoxum]|uniref:Uncharacterized protein n=1 Tax=Dendrobium chrysotoxum TaxID=161865 RepID=A0AAV7GT64_DENCH|nr:hypothetical protein IEQ34_012396 [Dendrobium chrysotoxum]
MGNGLDGSIPVSLDGLSRLSVLDLSINRLHGGFSEELGGLPEPNFLVLAGPALRQATRKSLLEELN